MREEDAGPYFAQAVELGSTFWDTAKVCKRGSSEEIRSLQQPYSPRLPAGF